ncbi:MAG TPA: acylglycerol kinase family protein, partial [Sporichthya sp.]|nr:acylglycerol kinase family protein [Sporichthya sp.]
MTPDLVRLVRRLCVPVVVLTAVLTVAGLAMHEWTGPEWPYEAHDSWRRFARGVEALGTAAVAVPPVVLIVAGMRVGFRRWRESVFLLTAMLIAGLALVVASAAVPGTSFPAAASGLAAATYGGLSVVLGRRLRTPARRTLGGIAPWFLVLGVAVSQLYLGEYRPEEIAISVATGVAAVGVATRSVLLGGSFEQRPAIDDIPLPDRRRAAVIVNPTKVADMEEERRAVTAYLAAAGWHQPWWLETRLDELGHGHAKAAAVGGADVVFACGGDGTIMSVLSGLAGTGVPLAILPAGTGNL